jgi:hypothetical protein
VQLGTGGHLGGALVEPGIGLRQERTPPRRGLLLGRQDLDRLQCSSNDLAVEQLKALQCVCACSLTPTDDTADLADRRRCSQRAAVLPTKIKYLVK